MFILENFLCGNSNRQISLTVRQTHSVSPPPLLWLLWLLFLLWLRWLQWLRLAGEAVVSDGDNECHLRQDQRRQSGSQDTDWEHTAQDNNFKSFNLRKSPWLGVFRDRKFELILWRICAERNHNANIKSLSGREIREINKTPITHHPRTREMSRLEDFHF